MEIAFLAVRLALGAFVVPIAFIYNQELLMLGEWQNILITLFKSGAGLILLAIAVEGFIKSKVTWWNRIILAVAGVYFLIPGVFAMSIATGFVVFYLILLQIQNKFTKKI